MIALTSFIVFCQALGAIVGVITSVWGEFAYLRAMRDGKIDHAERAHLRVIAHGLRFGMTLLLTASLALVILAYTSQATLQPALTASYWTLILFALLAVYATWALSRNHISFAFGSAVVFTAWWLLAYLTLGQMPLASFGATVAFFVVATAIFYFILEYTRKLIHSKR